MMIQENFDKLLKPIIKKHFDIGMSEVPSMRNIFFNVQDSQLAEEKGVGIGGMSVDAWNQYKNTNVKGRLAYNQQYEQRYVHVEYPVTVALEKKAIMNAQDSLITKTIQMVGESAEEKMELDAVSILNNAFSSSHTWSDSVALCSASHPVGPNTTGTYSNRGTLALTKANLTATRIAMTKFKDDKGNQIGVLGNELWVPEELYDLALELTRSPFDPESANNAINTDVNARRWSVYPWMRLTDTNNWFVSSRNKRRRAANWYIRERTEPMLIQETTTDYIWEFKLHYSYGVDDWRFIQGNEVA